MGKNGGVDFREFNQLRNQLVKMDDEVTKLIEDCAKELAARFLAKVIKRTPVGDYTKEVNVTAKRNSKKYKKGDVYTKKVADGSGKVGGTLRRGWTGGTNLSGKAFASGMKVYYSGGQYILVVTNSVEYASHVEFGHRGRNLKGWTKGRFMMTISEKEIEGIVPALLEKKVTQKMKEWLGG